MGTPLKQLRLFTGSKSSSPLSPSFGRYFQNAAPNATTCRSKKLPRRLFPGNSPLLHRNEQRLETKNKLHKFETTTAIKKTLLINTPNKSSILKNGFQENNGSFILGRGGFGTVIKGQHKGLDVAVKIIKKKHAGGEKNVVKISHENIVKTIEVFANPNESYCLVIMEYLPEYVQLQSALEDGIFEIDKKVRLKMAAGICGGIDFCHKNGLLHLDLKPSNVLLRKSDGLCKLCDFGNSRRFEEVRENFVHQGTVAYTSPEILLGKPPTTKSDVYSFGIIMWQLKFRAFPYGNIDNNETLIYKVVKMDLRPTTIIFEECERDYCQLYAKCWTKIPEFRPETEEVLNVLNEIIEVTQ